MLSNRESLEKTVDSLRELGRLEDVDEALVSMAMGLAEAVDADPTNAALWREYRAVERSLREVGKDDTSGAVAFWDLLSSEIRNAKDPESTD